MALFAELLHLTSTTFKNLETNQLPLRTVLISEFISEPVNIGFKIGVVAHSINKEKARDRKSPKSMEKPFFQSDGDETRKKWSALYAQKDRKP